mmetsp:Transcript_51602/g.101891  ORF Transcript_51602/g.101891 Transcript_51602/m.101891 type:complete len:210 (-) Transcript_51602:62-691(-)
MRHLPRLGQASCSRLSNANVLWTAWEGRALICASRSLKTPSNDILCPTSHNVLAQDGPRGLDELFPSLKVRCLFVLIDRALVIITLVQDNFVWLLLVSQHVVPCAARFFPRALSDTFGDLQEVLDPIGRDDDIDNQHDADGRPRCGLRLEGPVAERSRIQPLYRHLHEAAAVLELAPCPVVLCLLVLGNAGLVGICLIQQEPVGLLVVA